MYEIIVLFIATEAMGMHKMYIAVQLIIKLYSVQ